VSGSLAGAVKAHIESLGLGLTVFRDGAPASQGSPYVTIQEGIGTAPELHGDFGDSGAHQGEREMIQIDLYQQARKTSGAAPGRTLNVEDYDLPGKLRRALTGTLGGRSYGTPTRRIYGSRVASGQRFPIADNIVRHTFTVEIRRDA
jgi:hypothetical protein